MSIHEAIMHTPLGPLVLHSADGVICGINFSNDESLSEVVATDEVLEQAVQQFQAYFAGQRQQFDFAFSQAGTPFQQKVWSMLCTIPHGTTISYKQLAIQLGDVKCIRAAGTANGRNQLAIVVPCHRVVGSQGELVGYAGGLWRKQWLLQHEARMAGRSTQGALFG